MLPNRKLKQSSNLTPTVLLTKSIIPNHCFLLKTLSIIMIVGAFVVFTKPSFFVYGWKHSKAMMEEILTLIKQSTVVSLLATSGGFAAQSSTRSR